MRVGFIGIRYPKGIGVLLECFARLVESKGHTVFFLSYPISKRRPCLTTGAWTRKNVTIVDTFKRSTVKVSDEAIYNWVRTNKLDVVFTIEEPNNPNTFRICKALSVPTINYVDIEKFNPKTQDLYEDCNIFFCPTQQCYDTLFEYGIQNLMLVRYIANVNEYPWKLRQADSRVEFICHAGWGGASGRKGVEPTIKAFIQADHPNAVLTVITQKRWKTYDAEMQTLVLSRKNVNIVEVNDTKAVYNSKAYSLGHVVVQPSMWEGLGLTYIEAMISGMPAITTDAPPMNEYVQHNQTGLLVEADIVPGRKIKRGLPIPAALVKVDKLAEAITYLADNPHCIEHMSNETLKFRNKHAEYVESFCNLFQRIGRPL